VKCKETSIFLTEPILNPLKNKQKMCESIFETFQVPRLQVGVQALMSLYSQGMLEGLLLDSGDGVTHCIPVVDSMIMEHQIMRINLAGRHVTDYLSKLLMMRGYALNSSADFEAVRELKERFCFVSANVK
jgi:actin-related protein 2